MSVNTFISVYLYDLWGQLTKNGLALSLSLLSIDLSIADVTLAMFPHVLITGARLYIFVGLYSFFVNKLTTY